MGDGEEGEMVQTRRVRQAERGREKDEIKLTNRRKDVEERQAKIIW